ncbi:MAG TPA: PAS domain-containing protein [Roseiflexaceae bacterium]
MNQLMTRSRSLPYAAQTLLLAAAYAGSGYAGLLMAIPPGNTLAVWPPAGIALAAVLLWGARAWPGIWLGALLVNLWTLSGLPNAPSIATSIVVSAGIAAGSTLQALAGLYLIRRLIERRDPLERAGDVFRFAILSLAFCLVAATVGVTILTASGLLHLTDYTGSRWTWWLGDVAGVLIIAPLLLAWRSPPRWLADRRAYVEAIGLLLLLIATGQIVFGGWPFALAHVRPLPYLFLPLLVWAALRFGRQGATLAIFLTTAIALWGTVRGIGPFAVGALEESLLLLQSFIGVVALTILALAAALAERRQPEAALQQARDELERRVLERAAILDNIPDIAWLKDKDGRFIVVNEPFGKACGVSPEDLVGKNDFDIWPRDLAQKYRDDDFEVIRTGRRKSVEEPLQPLGAEQTWAETIKMPIFDERGAVIGTIGIARDITARKQAEELLRRSKEELAALVEERTAELQAANTFLDSVIEHLPIPVFIKDAQELRFVRWNTAGAELVGYSGDTLRGKSDHDFFPSEQAEFFTAKDREVLASGALLDIPEEPIETKSQGIRILHTRKIPILDAEGRPQYLLGITEDITERKRTEDALRASEEAARRFQEHLKALHEVGIELSTIDSFDELCRRAIELGCSRLDFDRLGIWLLDEDPSFMVGTFGIDEHGQIRDGRQVRLPIDPNQLVGEIYYGALPIYFRQDTTLLDNYYGAVGHGWNAMAALWDRDRVIGYISADNLLLRQPIESYQLELLGLYGATLGHLCVRKRTEEAILRLNVQLERRVAERTAQLEAANQELEAFSYSVSHDLRAPLRHIGGFAQLLLKREAGRLDATSGRYLGIIAESIERMGRLIDDLLALSRTSRAEMRMRQVALGALVEEVRRELAPLQHGRQLAWEIGALPNVEADPALLRIALVNLLSNAIKYTSPRPWAHIAVRATPGADGEQIIAISDDGVGFDMQYAHKLFGVFQRLHRDDEFEGTGIGLATVRRVIYRHGGRVWAEGAPDRGATFYFTLKGADNGVQKSDDPASGG